MKKVLGWILALLGLFFVAFGVEILRPSILKFLPFLEVVDVTFSLAFGVVVLIIAVFFLRGKKYKQIMKDIELPIFQGSKIIGYRRN